MLGCGCAWERAVVAAIPNPRHSLTSIILFSPHLPSSSPSVASSSLILPSMKVSPVLFVPLVVIPASCRVLPPTPPRGLVPLANGARYPFEAYPMPRQDTATGSGAGGGQSTAGGQSETSTTGSSTTTQETTSSPTSTTEGPTSTSSPPSSTQSPTSAAPISTPPSVTQSPSVTQALSTNSNGNVVTYIQTVINTPTVTSSTASATATDDNGGDGGIGGKSIAGIVVAGVLAVLGIGGFIWWKLSKKRFSDFDDGGQYSRIYTPPAYF